MAAQQAKVLRVGILHNGKIVEERVLPARQPVTIGSTPRNTLVVAGAQLPATLPLFAWHGDRCVLSFGAGAQGRIQGPQGEADLSALVAQGLAAKQGAGYAVPVREDQRGKIVVGDVTVLWQFVSVAPEAPRPNGPIVNRGNHFQSMDRLFATVLLVSFLLHGGLYAALAAMPLPKEKDATLEEIPDRYARMIIPEKKEPPKALEKQAEVATEAKAEQPAETKKEPEKPGKKGEGGSDTPEKKAAHAAAVAQAVRKKGILGALAGMGPGATGKAAVADVFGAGGTSDVASALQGASGVAQATAADTGGMGQRKGGGQGGAATIGSLATGGGGGGKVGYGAKSDAVVKVSGSVAAEAAEVDSSEVDQAKLGSFVRARMSALKNCYENALKRNPGLKGRMRIRFTILETGGLSDISAVENALGPEVSSCITNTMRGWRLPFRPSGPVTVDYPLVFTPGG